jgi:hypothetical protein
MMHYWNLLWDWNNLDAVRAVHSFFEGWALVFFALLVIFDVLAHLAVDNKPRAKTLERIGLVCFAVAVLAEGLAYPYSQRNDTLSERIIVSLSGLSGAADTKARQALGDSSVAITEAKKAVEAAGQAKTSASSALVLSRGARKEADSFEKDIVSAKQQAADAESHLAEALERADKAEKATARNTEKLADRHLTRQQQLDLAAKLVKFQSVRLQIELDNSDGEIKGIGEDIAKAFWLVAVDTVSSPTGFSGMQVWIRQGAPAQELAFAAALASALKVWFPDTVGPISEPTRTLMGGGGQAFTPPAMVVLAISKKP